MWINEFKKLNLEYVKYDEDLKKYNTFKVGGIVNVLAFPRNIDELIFLIKYAKNNKIKYMILGNGSNVIFSSKTYDGIIVKLDNINNITYEDNFINIDAGASLIKISNELSNKGITGFEFATGIPGSIGGAVFMNAGAYNSSMSEIIESVTFLDENLNIKIINKDECKFGYRDSIFKHKEYIILSAKFKIEKGNVDSIKNLVIERRNKRMESQPLDKPSAGSTFRNPEGYSSWKLIDDANLRGKRVGGVSVSTKHSNFIINDEDGTGEDIVKLVSLIQKEVKDKYNIDLILEPELVNF